MDTPNIGMNGGNMSKWTIEPEEMFYRMHLEMEGERMSIMEQIKTDKLEASRDHTSGEPSYGMAILSGKRSDKMQELETQVSGLSLLRDHAEEELGKTRIDRDRAQRRCEELERQNANIRHGLAGELADAQSANEELYACTKQAEAERD